MLETLSSLRLPAIRTVVLVLSLVVIPVTALGLGNFAFQRPAIAIALIVGSIIAFAILNRPDAATLVVIFILYTNIAVVAVQFHHVPFIIGAAVPGLLLIPLAYHIIWRRQEVIVNTVMPWIMLFMTIQLVGAVFAVKPDAAMAEVLSSLIEGFGLYVLILNVVRTPPILRRVIWVLLLSGLIMAGLTVFQQVTGTFDTNYGGLAQMSNSAFHTGEETAEGEVDQRRLSGPIGHQNRYAQILLMLVPLGLFRFWGEKTYALRALAVLSTVVILAGAALTFSRGGAVGLVFALILMGFMRYIKFRQLAGIFLVLSLIAITIPAFGTRFTSLKGLTDLLDADLESDMSGTDTSVRSRLTEMLAAVLVFADHPIFGVGPDMYREHYRDYSEMVGIRLKPTNRQAHSLYLGLASENGLLGLTAFCAVVFVTLRNLASARRRYMDAEPELANMATAFLLALVVYLATAFFLHLAFIRYFWLMMALAGAASYIAHTRPIPTLAQLKPASVY